MAVGPPPGATPEVAARRSAATRRYRQRSRRPSQASHAPVPQPDGWLFRRGLSRGDRDGV